MTVRASFFRLLTFASAGSLAIAAAHASTPSNDGLIFRVSADKGFDADVAGGDPVPNFRSDVQIVPNGRSGGAIQWQDDGYIAWKAPGNIYAERGTLSFFWRPREKVTEAPFVIFRVGFADHTSWDMTFLRIDWNGHGFDAFVTDTNLARERVSWTMPDLPAADSWHHIAFAWDETKGVVLYVDGKEVARKDQRADLNSGLDQLGLAGRVIAPHQVQSRYNFMRGSDIDELRVYNRMLGASSVAALATDRDPDPQPAPDLAAKRQAWLHRYGWDHGSPPPLDAETTSIRKVEFSDAKDLKEWMWKGIDGIPETTWPGVYNRSRLPGRDDYFELPDWNVYVQGGKDYTLTIPDHETVNRIGIRGAAYGTVSYAADGEHFAPLFTRPEGEVRSTNAIKPVTAGKLRFTNVAQETPIQEFWAYDIKDAPAPKGTLSLDYTVKASVAPDFAALDTLNAYIAGRYPVDERSTVVALPPGADHAAPGAASAADAGKAVRSADMEPVVNVLIPSTFDAAEPDKPLARAWNYTWANVHDGLDGLAIDLPALHCQPNQDGLIPLDIIVHDPIWPDRQMMAVEVSVKPGEPRKLWLDLRDRILTNDSFYLTVASASPDFNAQSLDGMHIRLVFKDRKDALKEHIADRFNQVKDNWGFLVEEHTASQRESLYRRLYGDITDLLRVDPDNIEGRRYWNDISYGATGMPPFDQPKPPAGEPLWAFRQLENLKLVQHYVDWWIDNRQVPYGDFGGGISDDTDMTQQWPGLALMGVEPDKVNASLKALDDASYKNGMHVNGLAYVTLDELHAYEEGLNSDAERLYLNWGEPKTIENLMATTKALSEKVILRNPAGHMHFATNWYGGRKIYRMPPFDWQKPYSYVVTHAPILIGVFNDNPTARGLITGLMDGWLAHGKKGPDGNWTFPNEINWHTDAERKGDGGGANTPMQSAWAAYRFTGDDKYLRPILGREARSGPGSLSDLNENVIDVLGHRDDWGKQLVEKAAAGSDDPFTLYTAWDVTGDKAYLDTLHADAIESDTQHMYMYTEGHWWSDRVDQPNEILQRERLGGIALKRNQTYPGNAVSWRFDHDDAATKVAILMPDATTKHFKVIAYNTSDAPQAATMTTWNVAPGQWRMTGDNGTHDLPLNRSASTRVSFAPHTTTTLDFTLVRPGQPVDQRPDLGIGDDDVAVTGNHVAVTVHSLGAQPTTGGTASLVDDAGKVLASAPIAPLAAPTDLVPKTTKVSLPLPAGADRSRVSVRIALPGDAPEITMLNNTVALAQATGK
jgi:hypothetical protein